MAFFHNGLLLIQISGRKLVIENLQMRIFIEKSFSFDFFAKDMLEICVSS